MKALLALAALLLVTGCTSGDDSGRAGGSSDDGAPGAQSPPTLAVPSPDASDSPDSPDSPDTGVAGSKACAEVVAGINAFNQGDYDETISRFEAAVPLAEEQDDGSSAAADLVEAVKYYADLGADDYLDASRSSPDFAKYKAITLNQCASDGGVDVPGGEPSGVPA